MYNLRLYSGLARRVGNNGEVQRALQAGAQSVATRVQLNILMGGHVESGQLIKSVKVRKDRHVSGVVDRTVEMSHPHIIAIEQGHFVKRVTKDTSGAEAGQGESQGTARWVPGINVMGRAIASMKRR